MNAFKSTKIIYLTGIAASAALLMVPLQLVDLFPSNALTMTIIGLLVIFPLGLAPLIPRGAPLNAWAIGVAIAFGASFSYEAIMGCDQYQAYGSRGACQDGVLMMGAPAWIAAFATILRYGVIAAGIGLARLFYGPWRLLEPRQQSSPKDTNHNR